MSISIPVYSGLVAQQGEVVIKLPPGGTFDDLVYKAWPDLPAETRIVLIPADDYDAMVEQLKGAPMLKSRTVFCASVRRPVPKKPQHWAENVAFGKALFGMAFGSWVTSCLAGVLETLGYVSSGSFTTGIVVTMMICFAILARLQWLDYRRRR